MSGSVPSASQKYRLCYVTQRLSKTETVGLYDSELLTLAV